MRVIEMPSGHFDLLKLHGVMGPVPYWFSNGLVPSRSKPSSQPTLFCWVCMRRHQTLSALLVICAGNSPIPMNSPHKGQWRGALMFSLIWAWINGWVKNCEAGDLRRNHYDVIVMWWGEVVCCAKWVVKQQHGVADHPELTWHQYIWNHHIDLDRPISSNPR